MMKIRIFAIAIIILAGLLAAGNLSAFEKALLTGQVFDIKGNKVKGVEIFVYGTSDTRRPADFISARTDDDGRYRMSLPLKTSWVVARSRQGEKYGPLMPGDRHSGEPVEIELDHAGEFIQDFNVMDIIDAARLMKKIREDYIKISGRVLDQKGMPVSDVYVFANRTMGMKEIPDYISGWADAEGAYTIYVPAGNYYLGDASEFPVTAENRVLIGLTVNDEKNDIDIIVYPVNTTEKEGAGELK
jgi:hypothetical protein